jgi:hypothetical protein
MEPLKFRFARPPQIGNNEAAALAGAAWEFKKVCRDFD